LYQKDLIESQNYYKNLNVMQEKIIGDLVGLMRKTIGDMSLNFIGKVQENLDHLKNPLSVIDPMGQLDLINYQDQMQSDFLDTNKLILGTFQENNFAVHNAEKIKRNNF